MGDEEEAPAMEEEVAEEEAGEAGEVTEVKRASVAPSTGSRKSVGGAGAAEGAGGGGETTNSIIRIEDVINLQILTAVIAGEIIHFCWYSDVFPWGSWHTRSFKSALIPDLVIAIILSLITSAYVPVTDHLASANMSLALSVLYMALEGTHTVWYPRNLAVFALHGLHKFLLLFAMSTAMMYVRTVAESDEFPEVNCFGGGGDEAAAAEGVEGETEVEPTVGEEPVEGAEEGGEAPAEEGEEGEGGEGGEAAPEEESPEEE